MSFQTIRPDTWEELHTQLFENDWDEELKRHRSTCVFRGMTNSNWGLDTSLQRLGGPIQDIEYHLLRNFKKYAHRNVVERDSFWNWLTVAQHHGVPTRLLDWTYSPYIALHFATDNISSMNIDGVVWVVDMPSVHGLLPNALKEHLRNEGSFVFTTEMLENFSQTGIKQSREGNTINIDMFASSISSLRDFGGLHHKDFGLFFEPSSIDDRVVNQFALFSVFSGCRIPIHDWLSSNQIVAKKIIVPASLKWKVRDRLDQSNITERVIYPGLDGLATWLKRHYSKGPEN
ncbi:FRG domain-containing protein [Ruegeria sp. HKCCSP346]|uniref:FRG domain-containing protein n=1 Tax=Ruegeria sp. HKCCSP346 TaxID=2794830 RepID=UPI001AE1B844|nr:FRG domain-containing protein [Ruegeria sp. HKCCSP346]